MKEVMADGKMHYQVWVPGRGSIFTDGEHFLDVVSDAVDGPREDKRRNETSVDEGEAHKLAMPEPNQPKSSPYRMAVSKG